MPNTWTASANKPRSLGADVYVDVTYTNGNSNFTETYTFGGVDQINKTVTLKLEQLRQREGDLAGFVEGVITPKLPPIDPPPPSETPNPRGEFQLAKTHLQNLKTLVDLGILSQDSEVWVAAQNLAKELFRVEFVDGV